MSYAAEVLADSPLIYWRLGEASGTVAADTSGNANTGTYTNGPTLGTTGLLAGDSNTAITVDGVDDSVRSAPFSASYTTLSVEALIKPTDFSISPFVCGFEDDVLNLTVNADGSVLFGAGATTFTTSAGMIVVGSTYHLAATSSGSVAKIYVNGALAATGSAGTVNVSALGFWAGDDSFSDPFAGVIDEVAFYETALSPARILAHATAAGLAAAVTEGPTVRLVTSRALAVPHQVQRWVLPIICKRFANIGPDDAIETQQDVSAVREFFLGLRRSGTPVTFQEGAKRHLVVVRDVSFPDGMVEQWGNQRDGLEGLLFVTIESTES